MSAVHAIPANVQAVQGAGAPVVVRSHLRLTSRGRVVFTTLVALPIVAGALMFAVNGGGAVAGDASQQGASFDYISVPPGESLWTLAVDLAPQADPRDVIAAFIELNQLDSSQVQAGQRLAVPAGY
ncbi:LysM domain-containing protein [Microterricola viridarii]|uniref:LysM domain-containing protein n=1 Tax=Microterricola viridarii TaxID=412690 RepID=A0A1H1WZM1_9MICO|nr:LysM peptidoglycan-binding domain-containing protein [Microterricola viridarii]SDT02271.1 LysM domain-containing protein [Microterricola viridarii]